MDDALIPELAEAMAQVNRDGGAQPFKAGDGGSLHDWEEHARRIVLQSRGEDWTMPPEA
jgi:hypothetical protein